MRSAISLLLFGALFLLPFSTMVCAQYEKPLVELSDEAREIHERGMLFDGHNDLPWAMRRAANYSFDRIDIAEPTDFHTDIDRLKKGGLKAQYWSVYVPATDDAIAVVQTLQQIEFVHKMCKTYPEVFELALTADDVERIAGEGKIASLIGVEGGHSIHDSLQVLRELYDRGARYMTLTHSKTLAWADSATDDAKNDGLSPFGKLVIEEMNRLGMLCDLSHVSPKTMRDTLEITQAPIIFSHSSAKAICDHPRNVPDDILELVAENRGVVMVNFYSGYIVPTDIQDLTERRFLGNVQLVVDHIDHIKEIAGIECVGLGADYDGVNYLPKQLEDVSGYPFITQEMLNRGYTEEEIHMVLGGNALRVLREAETAAARIKAEDEKQAESETDDQ